MFTPIDESRNAETDPWIPPFHPAPAQPAPDKTAPEPATIPTKDADFTADLEVDFVPVLDADFSEAA